MSREAYYKTKYCVVCSGEIFCWTGHVHLHGKYHATSGWCKEHQRPMRWDMIKTDKTRKVRKDCQGCCGEWKRRDGLITEVY